MDPLAKNSGLSLIHCSLTDPFLHGVTTDCQINLSACNKKGINALQKSNFHWKLLGHPAKVQHWKLALSPTSSRSEEGNERNWYG